jgi:NAD(P)-dependent dehydrogenase (short-subunit alcohol dehydrogenase family)
MKSELMRASPKNYQPSTTLLQGRVIVVTGAGDGIGRAVALVCAKHSATVVLLGKTVAKLEAVYDQIAASGAPEAAIYPMNLQGANVEDYTQLANTLENNFGCIHGLVNNAAELPYLSRLKDYEQEDWLKAIQVNLNAPFLMTQACLPLLQAAPDASVIFTGDTALANSIAFGGAYAISKNAVTHLMQLWASELSRTNIRVNLLEPGPTATRLRKMIFPGEQNNQLHTPDQVASSHLWLLGMDSQAVRGQVVRSF